MQNNRKVDPLNILTPIRSDRHILYVLPLAPHTELVTFSTEIHGVLHQTKAQLSSIYKQT